MEEMEETLASVMRNLGSQVYLFGYLIQVSYKDSKQARYRCNDLFLSRLIVHMETIRR